LIFCGKKEVAEKQVTLLQMKRGDLTQKEEVRNTYIRHESNKSSQEFLASFIEGVQGSQYFRDLLFCHEKRPKRTYPKKINVNKGKVILNPN
jgi:hypothetical protein